MSEQHTGRRRHRSHGRWFGPPLIVVQVEVIIPTNDGNSRAAIWRDATPEDMMNDNTNRPLPPPPRASEAGQAPPARPTR